MQPIQTNCPHCHFTLEYWTKNNYIKCPKCNDSISVEPCEDILDHEKTEEETPEEPDNPTIEETT